jgi:hypothetical protein
MVDSGHMTLEEALEFQAELKRFVTSGPGDDDAAVRRLAQIKSEFDGEGIDSGLREKVVNACYFLGLWLGSQKSAYSLDELRTHVNNSVEQVRKAIEISFRGPR